MSHSSRLLSPSARAAAALGGLWLGLAAGLGSASAQELPSAEGESSEVLPAEGAAALEGFEVEEARGAARIDRVVASIAAT